jgi:SsrA-binding protein
MSGLLLVKNRSALYDHQLINKYVAGIVLTGYEVKAVREKKVGFEASYVQILKDGPYVVNMFIDEYSKQSQKGLEKNTKRARKLLLNQSEIDEIVRELEQKGRTAIPLAIILLNNRIKLEFAVVKGKKEYEIKSAAKERQIKKDMQKELKEFRRSSDK